MRRTLMAIAVLLMAGGVMLLITGYRAPGSNLLVTGSVLLVVLVFERWRYRGPAGGGRWRATDERFEDPESGEVIEVQFDPATGQRRYVKAAEQPPRIEPR
jgi:hypothetical protein